MNSAEYRISIHDLLKYPKFRKYFCKRPAKMPKQRTPRWRAMVLIDGEWHWTEMRKYDDAFRMVSANLRTCEDAAIVDKRVAHKERITSPHIGGHLWCPYCRRPSLFTQFPEGHHMDRILREKLGTLADTRGTESLCSICGIPERTVMVYQRARGDDDE